MVVNYDVFHYPMEVFLLPDPMIRSKEVIVWSVVIRASLMFPVVAELLRSSTAFLQISVILMDSGMAILKILESRIRSLLIFKQTYIQFLVLYKMLEPIIYVMFYWFVTICFWGLVVAAWIVIAGAKGSLIPATVYFVALNFVVILLATHLILFPKYLNIVILLESLLQRNQERARAKLFWRRSLAARISWMEAKALPPLKIKLGPCHFVDKGFIMNHMDSINQRLCDAVVTLKIK